jgi:histidine triad (HIT) family protein
MHQNCLFCKIAAGTLPAAVVYQDLTFLVFKDIHPKASTHLLFIPRLHIDSLMQLTPEHTQWLGELMILLPKIATQQGILNGFRTVINTGRESGQQVDHLHIHLLAGQLSAF